MAPTLLATLPVLLLLAIAGVSAFEYQDCGSTSGVFSKVQISECDPPTASFCSLKKGSNASLAITFVPNENVNAVKAVVHGILGGIPIPFNLPNSDGCTGSGLTCPLNMGVEYVYKTYLPIRDTYPKVRVTVKWELLDEKNNDIICIELPAKIV